MSNDMDKYLFRIPQKALIKKNGKYLILKRSDSAKHYPMHWDLPGGKLEHGEEPREGLVREVKEETNLDVKVLGPIFSHINTKNSFAFIIVYKTKLIGGRIKLSFEHSEYKWATKKEILNLALNPFLKAYLLEK